MKLATADLDLQENVAEELAFDPRLDGAAAIGVAAKDGVVTLTGRVDTYAKKVAAEEAAKRVDGVKGLAADLTVELPEMHRRSDADIVAAALNVLAWDLSVPRDAVRVQAQNGWLTLEGTVDWYYQKERAEHVVRNLAGVRGLTNHIDLRPRVTLPAVKESLRRAFKRHAEIDADHVMVETNASMVTLRGTVHSWAEREDATHAAFSVPGVTVVENLTTVV
jgi:osmotically-inducible protein OsmY